MSGHSPKAISLFGTLFAFLQRFGHLNGVSGGSVACCLGCPKRKTIGQARFSADNVQRLEALGSE